MTAIANKHEIINTTKTDTHPNIDKWKELYAGLAKRNLKTNIIPEISENFRREINIKRSFKIQDINQNYSLWQIGPDLLPEFSLAVSEFYDARPGRKTTTPDEDRVFKQLCEHKDWFNHSVFLAAIGPKGIVATGVAIRLWDGNVLYETALSRKTFDVRGMIARRRPTEIWLLTQNALDLNRFQRDTGAVRDVSHAMFEYGVREFHQLHNTMTLSLSKRKAGASHMGQGIMPGAEKKSM